MSSKPIKTVIHCNIQFYELEPTGEVGKSLSPKINKENNIKNLVFSLNAKKDVAAAIDELNSFVDNLKRVLDESH